MGKFLTVEDLFWYLDRAITAHKEIEGLDLVPHLVLSHGFMEWNDLLAEAFPCIVWRGSKKEKENTLLFEEYLKFFYNRFFFLLSEFPAMQDISKEQKDKLKEEGWQAYLKD